MKQQDGHGKQQQEDPTAEPFQKGGGKAGRVAEGAVIPTDNSMEKGGEGDRTDTEEMHRLADDSEQ